MRWLFATVLALVLAGSAAAGELLLANGHRLTAELATDALLVSTGGDVIEIAAAEVRVVTPTELTLRDGRVIRGTLIGERLKTRTAYGELAVQFSDLVSYRADAVTAVPPGAPASGAPTPATPTGPPALAGAGPSVPPGRAPLSPESTMPATGPGRVVEGARTIGRGVEETAKGVGKTVVDGADRVHDGFKAVGTTIWDAVRSVGRTARGIFSGS
jgi:hypothetical protein